MVSIFLDFENSKNSLVTVIATLFTSTMSSDNYAFLASIKWTQAESSRVQNWQANLNIIVQKGVYVIISKNK